MSSGLQIFEDQKLIDLLHKSSLIKLPYCGLKSSKPKRSKSSHFSHSHEPVKILRAPMRGPVIDVGRGISKNHTTGNAIANYKHVDAHYCKDLFHSRYDTDPSIHYVGKPEILPYEDMPVLARWDLFGYYFLGKVSRILNNSYADIKFNNGHKQINLAFKNIIYLRRTKIIEGDYVMVNIINELDQDCWVPGMVQAIDHESDPVIYYVILYNETKCTKTFSQLLKIGRDRYYYIRDFILFLESKGVNKRDRYFQIEFEYELDLFGLEYRRLKLKYQPILQPSNGPHAVIMTTNNLFLSDRLELSPLKIGDRVLARWPDDGWYYPSIIRDNKGGNGIYRVENKLGAIKFIYREDLIRQTSNNQNNFQIGDTVVAQHPKFYFTFAPGEICRLSDDSSKLIIRFYDFSECLISKDSLYKIDRTKFESDVASIIEIENYWKGHPVLAYNVNSKCYEWGKVLGRIKNQRQMLIQWKDGQQTFQNAYYIFINKDYQRGGFKLDLDIQSDRNIDIIEDNNIIDYDSCDEKIEPKPPRTIRITQTEETTWEERHWDEDRATPILDVSEFFASKRRSKKFPNS